MKRPRKEGLGSSGLMNLVDGGIPDEAMSLLIEGRIPYLLIFRLMIWREIRATIMWKEQLVRYKHPMLIFYLSGLSC